MAGFNRVILIGNLTRDPEYKQLASGQAVCRLGLATNRQFKNRQTGSMVQEVCYIDIDVWGPQAESCKQYLQKGRPVLVEGRIKFDSWEDANGQTRSKHSIVADRVVFLSASGASESGEDRAVEQNEPRLPQNEKEQELFNQLEQIKARVESKAPVARKPVGATKAAPAPVSEDNSFTDQPPFQDDLPF